MLDDDANVTVRAEIRCSTCPVRHRAVCARADADELALLDSVKFYKTYQAGQTIALRGDPLEVLSSVVTGTATLSQSMEDGRTQIVGLLLPSDFIGRPGRDTVAHDVTAVTEVTLCCFRRKPFEDLLVNMPHVQVRLLEMTLDELDAARDWMLLLGRKTAREKIASFLLLIAQRTVSNTISNSDLACDDEVRISLPLSRETMATYLGLTIETVSRQFTALRKDGLITLDGTRTVIVPDVAALSAEVGDGD
ncbi:MAG: Crp/Fnr family transcriptional regulator [Boseongicola sp.]|nr:Crp/Fnr family transcriptional regulator [Boseongicola sp.]NNL18431.1 Crp/Fnr family transcriptional regulator [Boseongicola sp.]